MLILLLFFVPFFLQGRSFILSCCRCVSLGFLWGVFPQQSKAKKGRGSAWIELGAQKIPENWHPIFDPPHHHSWNLDFGNFYFSGDGGGWYLHPLIPQRGAPRGKFSSGPLGFFFHVSPRKFPMARDGIRRSHGKAGERQGRRKGRGDGLPTSGDVDSHPGPSQDLPLAPQHVHVRRMGPRHGAPSAPRECPDIPKTGRGDTLLTVGEIESHPGPSLVLSLAESPDHMQPTGRGFALLSHGDVESNPGPPAGPPRPTLAGEVANGLPPGPARSRARPPPMEPYQSGGKLANVDCVLGCARSWSSLPQLWRHVERAHGPTHRADPQLLQWLGLHHKRFCPTCALLVPIRGPCAKCRNLPPECQPAPLAAFVEPAVLDWTPVLSSPYRVVDYIPPECVGLWQRLLAVELALITPTSGLPAAQRLFGFIRVILQPPARGGKGRPGRQLGSVVKNRLQQWETGHYVDLRAAFLSEVSRQSSRKRRAPVRDSEDLDDPGREDTLSDMSRRRVLKLARRGLFSKAAKSLGEQQHALPDDLAAKLLSLHPRQGTPPRPEVVPYQGDDFSSAEVAAVLAKFPRGSAGGLSGLTADTLRGPAGPDNSSLLEALGRLCSDFAWNRLAPDVSSFLAGARLLALGKPAGGVRPIAIGDTIRRLTAKLLVVRYQRAAVEARLLPLQVGVGLPGGAELIIHKARHWFQFAAPGEALLQLDFSNAFNCFHRGAMLSAVAEHCPAFLPYALACYGRAADLYHPAGNLTSEAGVHQGDPLGPLFFALVAQPLADLCANAGLSWSHWYLDDGYLCGPEEALSALFPKLEEAASQVGLRLNVAKCAVLSPHNLSQGTLPGVPRVPPGGTLRVLGAPVGGLETSVDWVQENVIRQCARALTALTALGDPHLGFLILRHCLSGCKVSWGLRNCDPEVARVLAVSTEDRLRKALEMLVGCPLEDDAWTLASLPVCSGGLGISNPVDIWEGANLSSWFTAASSDPTFFAQGPSVAMVCSIISLASNVPSLGGPLRSSSLPWDWDPLLANPLRGQWASQKAWSREVWSRRISAFNETSPARTRLLRMLQATPNAGAWLAEAPGDFSTLSFTAPEWQALLRFRLGIPLAVGHPHPVPGAEASPTPLVTMP